VAIFKIQSAEALGRTHELAAERDRTLQAVSVTRQQLLDDPAAAEVARVRDQRRGGHRPRARARRNCE